MSDDESDVGDNGYFLNPLTLKNKNKNEKKND